jgi:hypothetical protein
MQHAHGGADATAAAAAATVAPLLQLRRAADKAENLARFSRAVELYKRALAAAELAQPRDSLIIAALLDSLFITLITSHKNIMAQAENETAAANVRGLGPELAEVNLRSLLLLRARWQAGTLFVPTAEEVAYLVEDNDPCLPAQMCGAFFYIRAAHDMPPPMHVPADAEVCLQILYGALRTALEMDARGMLERNPRTGQAWPSASSTAGTKMMVSSLKWAVHGFVTAAFSDEAGLLHRLRTACGLSAAEETALRQLAERHKLTYQRRERQLPKQTVDVKAEQQQAAAADAARHGLRRCALPACDAQEAHPKLFKLCGRCRGAAYCCAAHSVEDWKRHKRADGCKAAP